MAWIKKAVLLILIAIPILVCFHTPQAGAEEGTLASKLGSAVSTLVKKVKGETFTILKIESRPAEGVVNVWLSDQCDLSALKRNLKLTPAVASGWRIEGISADNVLTLRGEFQPGQKYTLLLPNEFVSISGRLYATGITSFTVPKEGAGGSVLQFSTGPTFTISQITADPKEKLLRIQFTDQVNIWGLRYSMKFLPPIPLYWDEGQFSDKNLFTIRGEFKPGQKYALHLPESLKSNNGRTYEKGVTLFTVPDFPSEISFLENGRVIERDSRQMVHLQLTNVSEVRFKGLRLPPILVPFVSREPQPTGEPSWEAMKAEYTGRVQKLSAALAKDADFQPFLGQVTEEGQLFFNDSRRNELAKFSLPLTFRQEKEKGAIELVKIVSGKANEPAHTMSRLYRITDIGLSYKISSGDFLVWATSLRTGRPLEGVALLAFTADGEAAYLGKTGKEGLLKIADGFKGKRFSLQSGREGAPGTKPLTIPEITMVAAASSTDCSFIEIKQRGNIIPEGIAQAPAGGQGAPSLLRGTLFTERGIYRPGDTVHFKGAVRQYRDGAISPPSGNVTVRMENAKGEEIYRKELKPSEFGTIHDRLEIKPFFPLGTYTLSMTYGPGDSDTASQTFQVQEFRQPRHYVEVLYKRDAKKDDRYVNLPMQQEILNCEISGKYYAGGPVKHGKVRWSIYHAGTDYNRPDHSGYTFGYPVEGRTELIESGESMLDESGKIIVPVPLGKEVLSGRYGIEVTASVVDFDGRASTETATYQGDPEYLVGIGNHPFVVEAGDGQFLQGVVIDRKGNRLQKGTVTVQVQQKGVTHIQKRNADGNFYWEQQQVWRNHLSVDLPIIDGVVPFEFDFAYGGDFLVIFTYKGSDGREYTSGTEYHVTGGYYGYEDEGQVREKSFEKLSMTPEKSLYGYGETIKLYLNPRRQLSSCLVSVEQGSLVEYFTMELKPGQRTLELPVKEHYAPNVYISVLGTVPRSSFPVHTGQVDTEAPTFLFGTVNVEVKGGQQGIKIGVNEEQAKLKALPGSEMTLRVTTKDMAGKGIESEVALCVVDESILSMTGFATPSLEILGKFITPLGVYTGELRTDLLKQTPYSLFRNTPLTGGDGEEGKAPEAATSKIRKDFNPVAYYNPALRTDVNGEATVTIKYPDTMTTYRIYAVACDKGSRFGSFQRSSLVVKDFYLEPGLPAFLTRGDAITFFVSAFNKTDKSGHAAFTAKGDNLVTLSAASPSHSLAAGDRTLIPVKGIVKGVGTMQAEFSGTFRDSSDVVQLSIPVNSGHVLDNRVLLGSLRKEATVTFTFPKEVKDLRPEDLGANELKALLTVSGSPFLRMAPGLRYLLHYPYGCVEQTSSGVLPLAALRGLIKKGLLPGITIEETDKFIKPGIERLFSMQTATGGFGYWPGERLPHKWGTIYAMTALTRAKLAGMDLPADRMDKALAFLQESIRMSGNDDPEFRSFAAYLLALNGKLDKETFRIVYEGGEAHSGMLAKMAGSVGRLMGIDQQPREAAILTLMAAKIGKHLPDETIKGKLRPILERTWSWNRSDEFYSRYREPAVSLIAANMLFPREELTGRLAAKLMEGISPEGIWTSTSDTSWSLIALGEYFSSGGIDTRPTTITVRQGNTTIESFTLDPRGHRTVALDAAAFAKSPNVYVGSSLDQALLYKLEVTFPRIDYAKNGYSNGLEIHKSIRNTDGSSRIKVGDIVEVKLRVNVKPYGVKYLVIDDPLPAGFVAINSAIKTEEQPSPKRKKQPNPEEGEGGEEEDEYVPEMEFGDGFTWSPDYYWNPAGYYIFAPSFFEMKNDRVLAFKNRVWQGVYEYSYYARAVCEGEFVLPSSKVQLMYEPETAAFTPQGKVVIVGK